MTHAAEPVARYSPLWLCCGLFGLLLEVVAVDAVLEEQLWIAAFSHVASAVELALVAANGRLRQRAQAAFAVLLWTLSLPLLGALGVCAVVLPAWRALRPIHDDGVIEIDLPELVGPMVSVDIRKARPVETVLDRDSSVKERVESIMALRQIEAERAVPLLRMALLDAHEEVRLLAYAILERREKQLRARIEAARSELKATDTRGASDRRAVLLEVLGETHWELVHGCFVTGELEASTLELASRYGHSAYERRPNGSLALLLARIRLRRGDAAGAQRFLNAAGELGVARSALAPLFAEVAFVSRRFNEIAPLLTHGGAASMSRPRLDAVVQFWIGRGSA